LLLRQLGRGAWFQIALLAIFLIAGCGGNPRATGQNDPKREEWAGRISLQVAGEPVQSFSASFELKGRAENGELTLISPLGNILGVLRWSPGQALLDRGKQDIQQFASIDELMERTTGAAIPLTALFAWLQGTDATASGWAADLSRYGEGRVSARRTIPAPEADLRIVLDHY
jgi:outer membrane lipoprotein LolB